MQVEVSKLIDEGRWTIYQKFLIACTALTIILDGVDNQILGLTMTSISKEWSLVKGSVTVWVILMMSPLGMMIGGAVGGWLGDRIGRRNSLLFSVLAFSVPTAAVYFAHNAATLATLRLLAGIGLGGAMPNATALASEYVPRRFRPLAVTITIVCVPTGSTLAAFVAGQLPTTFAWQNLFLYGGLISFALGLLLFPFLAESPRYLSNHPHRWPELTKLLNRFGLKVAPDATFVESSQSQIPKPRGQVRELFRGGLARDTFALFGAFFFCLLLNYLAFMVLPDALQTWGKLTKPAALNAMGWWSTGGIIGALAGGYIVHHFGSRVPMLAISAAAIVCAFIMAGMNVSQEHLTLLTVMLAILGGLVNAAQTTMYALAAHVYPTSIRSTGVGTSVAVGRIGNMLAPAVGYSALNMGNMPAYFAAFGVGMILVFIPLAIVRRHIDRFVALRTPEAMTVAAAEV